MIDTYRHPDHPTAATWHVEAEHWGYQLLRGASSGEQMVAHWPSGTCSECLHHSAAAEIVARPETMAEYALDLDLDSEIRQAMACRELRAAIAASGLSARQYAVQILLRDERTVRRWLAGDSPIPQAVVEFLASRED